MSIVYDSVSRCRSSQPSDGELVKSSNENVLTVKVPVIFLQVKTKDRWEVRVKDDLAFLERARFFRHEPTRS